ncbi:MAG: thiosulfate oxidation carrier complex protein SoxZ [Campylobacterales bacterium]|nr:thiosulfate oxidation carrier complex protein SoxZ [Campylobacterales bacterium]
MGNIKIKVNLEGDVAKAKIMIKHDMLTYDQAAKKGAEANFITYLTGKVGDKVVYEISSSQFLSKNPLFKFSFPAAKGDELTITYTDLKGGTESDSKKVK